MTEPGADAVTGTSAPPPRPDAPEDRAFWQALDAGVLVLAHCACGRCYARSQACCGCGAAADTMTRRAASGAAELVSHVVFDKAYHPYFAPRLPYVVAVVRLAEGPELVTRLVGVDAGALAAGRLRAGLSVRLRVVERDGQALVEAAPAD